jgi:hypothetical protein
MKISNSYPPNFDTIRAAFPDSIKPGVMFTYGKVIYAPNGVRVTPALIAHESIHAKRQEEVGGPEKWWAQYIDDKTFRFAEEVIAHQAEYKWFRQYRSGKCRAALHEIASRLSSPLYGSLVSIDQARKFVEQQIALRPYE